MGTSDSRAGAADVQPVHARQVEVQDDERRFVAAGDSQRGGPVAAVATAALALCR